MRFAQHFLKDPRLVAAMVAQVGLGADDVVYEIGPGRGIITRELAKVCGRVVAVEIDPVLFMRLEEAFEHLPNVELHNQDFLAHTVRHGEFKVFSSIPFNATTRMTRKLLQGSRCPSAAHLIVQRGAAMKLTGAGRCRRCAALAYPWWSMEVARKLRRADFRPVPNADAVLLSIVSRPTPLIRPEQRELYERFLERGFCRSGPELRQGLGRLFTARQWRRLAGALGFAVTGTPRELRPEQWLGLFRFFLEAASRSQVLVPRRWRHLMAERA